MVDIVRLLHSKFQTPLSGAVVTAAPGKGRPDREEVGEQGSKHS